MKSTYHFNENTILGNGLNYGSPTVMIENAIFLWIKNEFLVKFNEKVEAF